MLNALTLLFGCALLALTYATPAQARAQAKMHRAVFFHLVRSKLIRRKRRWRLKYF